MVIAKTEESMENLVSDFKERNIIKKRKLWFGIIE